MRTPFLSVSRFFALGLLGLGCLPATWADTALLRNGNTLDGTLVEVVGDVLQFRSGVVASPTRLTRLDLQSATDAVSIRGRSEPVLGEIIYMDDLTLKIRTDSGTISVFRMAVKDVRLGVASSAASFPKAALSPMVLETTEPPSTPEAAPSQSTPVGESASLDVTASGEAPVIRDAIVKPAPSTPEDAPEIRISAQAATEAAPEKAVSQKSPKVLKRKVYIPRQPNPVVIPSPPFYY